MIKSTPLTHITLKLNNTVIPVETFKFSAGEIQVKLDVQALEKIKILSVKMSTRPTLYITANIRSSDDIMTLLLVINAFREYAEPVGGIISHYITELTIPYCPYSRQDRVCSPGEAWGLKVFLETLMNAAPLDITITTWDLHNPLASYSHMISKNISSIDLFSDTFLSVYKNGVNLVSPDKGAHGRAAAALALSQSATSSMSGVVYLDKDRDPSTGAIRGIKLDEMTIRDPSLPFLIVDDICDGGRTFISAAAVLKDLFPNGKKGPVIDLYVTHGIFSAGFEALTKTFRHIYIANNVNGITLPRQVSVVTR